MPNALLSGLHILTLTPLRALQGKPCSPGQGSEQAGARLGHRHRREHAQGRSRAAWLCGPLSCHLRKPLQTALLPPPVRACTHQPWMDVRSVARDYGRRHSTTLRGSSPLETQAQRHLRHTVAHHRGVSQATRGAERTRAPAGQEPAGKTGSAADKVKMDTSYKNSTQLKPSSEKYQ